MSKLCTIVTGGAGFIGSGIIRELNNRGCDNILVVDDLGCSEKWKNLVGKRFVDCLHKDQLFDWLIGKESSIGAIVHMGACSSTTEKDCSYLLENNYRYSRRLAEFAFKHNIRFLYASSAATYGNGENGFSDDHARLEELQPLNMYGYSKHMFDLWLARTGQLGLVVGCKFFNVFGPNEKHKGKMASPIMNMVQSLQQKGEISLFASQNPEYGNGEQQRDFIYIKDVAAIVCDLLQSSASGIINVGTGKAASWNMLAAAVCTALHRPISIQYIPMPEELIGKYQYFTQAETKKMLSVSSTRYSLEQAVEEYVHYILSDTKW